MKASFTLAVLLAIAPAYVSAQNGSDLLQQALELERGKGQPDAALQLYRRIITEFPGDKRIAARALLQLAHLEEFRSQDQARMSYQQILEKYPDQTDIAAEARVRLSILNPKASTIYVAAMDSASGLIQRADAAFKPKQDFADRYPTWSPDGQYIAFVRTALQSKAASATAASIVVLSTQSREEKTYKLLGEGSSLWLPDSSGLLSFAPRKDGTVVYRSGLTGGSRELDNLNVPAVAVSLSPNGKSLYAMVTAAFEGLDFASRTIVVFDALTVRRREADTIALLPAEIQSESHSFLRISPNGTSLAIVRPGKDNAQIERCSLDGAVKVLVVQSGLVQGVAWSADNRFVLFATSDKGSKWRIMRVSADGGTPTFTGLEVTDLTYFDLSPDGQRIAFDGTDYAIRKTP